MKSLYYGITNGYDLVISVDENKNCRYLTQTKDFPVFRDSNEKEREEIAKEFLNTILDDCTWEDDCSYDDLFNDDVKIISETKKELF